VVAGTASAVGGRVRHRQEQKWARQDGQATEPEEPVDEVPQQRSAPPAKDMLEQLKELGDLKAQGVLTEDEFATQKAKILAG